MLHMKPTTCSCIQTSEIDSKQKKIHRVIFVHFVFTNLVSLFYSTKKEKNKMGNVVSKRINDSVEENVSK